MGNAIIITGRPTTGKTTLLAEIVPGLRKRWYVDGFVCQGEKRIFRRGGSASRYEIVLMDGTRLPWATKHADRRGFEFHEDTRRQVIAQLSGRIEHSRDLIIVLDDVGFLELDGCGFAEILSLAGSRPDVTLVLSVKKEAIADIVARFNLDRPTIFDLDVIAPAEARKVIYSALAARDVETVAMYSAVSGFNEVALGSLLHSLHIPGKGHFLAGLQLWVLIAAGERLRGRGLYTISFVTAFLKALSPSVVKIKPMAYILVQGIAFALPVSLFGWGFMQVLMGAVLTGWTTLALPLAGDVLIFGPRIVDAYLVGANKLVGWFGLPSISLWTAVAGVVLVRTLASLIVAGIGYWGVSARIVDRAIKRFVPAETTWLASEALSLTESHRHERGWAWVRNATSDLLRPGFVLSFGGAVAIMFFFLTWSLWELLTTVVRGLAVSWVTFLVVRRLDIEWLLRVLERRGCGNAAGSFRRTRAIVLQAMAKRSSPSPQK